MAWAAVVSHRERRLLPCAGLPISKLNWANLVDHQIVVRCGRPRSWLAAATSGFCRDEIIGFRPPSGRRAAASATAWGKAWDRYLPPSRPSPAPARIVTAAVATQKAAEGFWSSWKVSPFGIAAGRPHEESPNLIGSLIVSVICDLNVDVLLFPSKAETRAFIMLQCSAKKSAGLQRQQLVYHAMTGWAFAAGRQMNSPDKASNRLRRSLYSAWTGGLPLFRAARGHLGAVMARALGQAGAHVIVNGRDDAKLAAFEQHAARTRATLGRAAPPSTSPINRKRCGSFSQSVLKQLDILVNNAVVDAGASAFAGLASPPTSPSLMPAAVTAAFEAARAALPALKAAPRKSRLARPASSMSPPCMARWSPRMRGFTLIRAQQSPFHYGPGQSGPAAADPPSGGGVRAADRFASMPWCPGSFPRRHRQDAGGPSPPGWQAAPCWGGWAGPRRRSRGRFCSWLRPRLLLHDRFSPRSM